MKNSNKVVISNSKVLPSRKYKFGEYTVTGSLESIRLPDNQTLYVPPMKEKYKIKLVDSLKESMKELKKASPRLHDLLVDDLRRIVVIPYAELQCVGLKSDVDPDLLFLSIEHLLERTPKSTAGMLGHESVHWVVNHLDNTQEQEALAFQTEDLVRRKLRLQGISDAEIRKIMKEYDDYKNLRSILRGPSLLDRLKGDTR